MENTDAASTREKPVGKKMNLSRILFSVLLVLASLLLGFYTGTRYGLDVATNAALEFLEYKAADPVEIDLEQLDSEPAAVYGSDDAGKTVRVFIDLQCPSCSTFMEESLKNLQEDKTLRIEFYDYPSDSHKYARLAAAYSRCAVRQGVDYLSYPGKACRWRQMRNPEKNGQVHGPLRSSKHRLRRCGSVLCTAAGSLHENNRADSCRRTSEARCFSGR